MISFNSGVHHCFRFPVSLNQRSKSVVTVMSRVDGSWLPMGNDEWGGWSMATKRELEGYFLMCGMEEAFWVLFSVSLPCDEEQWKTTTT